MSDKSDADAEAIKNKSQIDASDEDVAVLYLLNLPQKSSRLKFTNIFKRAIKVDILNKRTLGVAEFRTGEAAASALRKLTSRELMIGGEKLTVSTKAPPMKGTYYEYNETTNDPAFLYVLNLPTGTKQEELGKLFQGVARVQIYGNLGIVEFKNGIAAATAMRKPSEKTIKGQKLVVSIHRPKNANAIIRAVKSKTRAKPIDEIQQQQEQPEVAEKGQIPKSKPLKSEAPGFASEQNSKWPQAAVPAEKPKETPVQISTPSPMTTTEKNPTTHNNHNQNHSSTKKSENQNQNQNQISLQLSNNANNSTNSGKEKSNGTENQQQNQNQNQVKNTHEDSLSLDSNLKPNPAPQNPKPSSKRSRQYKSRGTLEDILVINVVTRSPSGGGQNKRRAQSQPVPTIQDGDTGEDQATVTRWQRTHGENRGISDWQRTV